ncbi:NucA/NucB deoxyribonuclease domain-containing protein [Pseudarthrobacter enclensis]|uniref:NucA/NucB deoxyribonuclease domain-containing protein n=1 Tax=Pseudarthrobacter enclensis TaxID=993070 RepID=UPI003F4DC1F7
MGYTGSEWTLTFKAPKATNPVAVAEHSTDVRCDTAVPGKTTTGCVIPGITPGITYNSAYYPAFAAHISKAQQSGLPGGWDQIPLHRLVDTTLQAANRNKACPSSWVRPAGKSCDEYPFSSTHEGAYTGGGTARTWPGCEITLPQPSSTGPTGYSVCMITATENSSAGSALDSVLYAPNRVIAGDSFYVGVS